MAMKITANGVVYDEIPTQKYVVLDRITIISAKNECINQINQRKVCFSFDNASPPPLKFISYPDKNGIRRKRDHETNAPYIVISGGRSQWIAQGLRNSMKGANTLADARTKYSGYQSPNTFSNPNSPSAARIFIPWYAPARSGRSLYMLVHASEADKYHQQLKNYEDVYVIGYKFGDILSQPNPVTPNQNPYANPNDPQNLVGFGASRCAAINLAIQLQCKKVWIIDDDVVHIKGFPNSPSDVEKCMDNQNYWAIGFKGTKKKITNMQDKQIDFPSSNVFKNGSCGPDTSFYPKYVEQVVLWNVTSMTSPKNVNFNPVFMNSKEDLSICAYLDRKNNKYLRCDQCAVVKLNPNQDTQTPTSINYLDIAKDALMQKLRVPPSEESNIEIGNPNNSRAPTVKIDTYLSDNSVKIKNSSDNQKLKIRTMAVEDIFYRCIKANRYEDTLFEFNTNTTVQCAQATPTDLPKN